MLVSVGVVLDRLSGFGRGGRTSELRCQGGEVINEFGAVGGGFGQFGCDGT